MKRCIIFAGGRPEKRLPDGLDPDGAYIIAADKGYENVEKLGLDTDLAIGDFDSLEFPTCCCERLTFPKEKDDTDLMLAAREAIKRGFNDITILGAMGGRFDHTFGNIQVLAFIRSQGAWGRILSRYEQIMLVTPGKYTVSAKERFSLSLFAYSERVSGLTVKGVKYPLENGRIENTFPIGVSNEITGGEAEISFAEGKLLIVQSRI